MERKRPLSREEVVRVAGDIGDARIAAIIATGAGPEELKEAAAWAAGESDVMGEEERPLSGRVAAVYDILTAEETLEEEGG